MSYDPTARALAAKARILASKIKDRSLPVPEDFYSPSHGSDFGPAWNAMLAWGKANRKPTGATSGMIYSVSSPIDMDHRFTSLYAQGATISSNYVGPKATFNLLGENGTDHFFYGLARGGVNNLAITSSIANGAGKTTANHVAIKISNVDESIADGGPGQKGAALVALNGVYIEGFETGFTWGYNTWCPAIKNWAFFNGGRAAFWPGGLKNAGERISLSDGTVGNSLYGIDASGAGFALLNVSLDYIKNQQLIARGGASIQTTHCHFEGDEDPLGPNPSATEWWRAETGSSIGLHQYTIALTKARTISLGVADAASGAVINFGEGKAINTAGWDSYTPETLVAGMGTAPRHLYYTPSMRIPPSHTARNILGDGGFEKPYLHDAIDHSTDPLAVSISTAATDFSTGARGLKINPVAGKIGRAGWLLEVPPLPQIHVGLFWRSLLTAGGADLAYLWAVWRDANGVNIGEHSQTVTMASISAGFSRQRFSPFWSPAGAKYLDLRVGKGLSLNGTSDGIGYMALDRAIFQGSDGVSLAARDGRPSQVWTKQASSLIQVNRGQTTMLTAGASNIAPFLLPSDPVIGDYAIFCHEAGDIAANPITISRNGKTIRGANSDHVMSTPYGFVHFRWTGSTWVY